jgi:hypothetical protein
MEAVVESSLDEGEVGFHNRRTMDMESDEGEHNDEQSLKPWQDNPSIPMQKLSVRDPCSMCA